MSDFKIAFEAVMTHEVSPVFTLGSMARFANSGFFHDAVTGEVNKWGLTLDTLREIKWPGVQPVGSGLATPAEIALVQKLLPSEIMEAYEKYYWTPPNLGAVDAQIAASKILDMMVLHGLAGGAWVVQTALQKWFWQSPPLTLVKVDSSFGPQTLQGVNRIPATSLIPQLCIVFYNVLTKIANDNPADARFKEGWQDRAIWPYTPQNWAKMALPIDPATGLIVDRS